MFTSQREKWADLQVIALVELDIPKMRLRVVLARDAITERMRELEQPREYQAERQTTSLPKMPR